MKFNILINNFIYEEKKVYLANGKNKKNPIKAYYRRFTTYYKRESAAKKIEHFIKKILIY